MNQQSKSHTHRRNCRRRKNASLLVTLAAVTACSVESFTMPQHASLQRRGALAATYSVAGRERTEKEDFVSASFATEPKNSLRDSDIEDFMEHQARWHHLELEQHHSVSTVSVRHKVPPPTITPITTGAPASTSLTTARPSRKLVGLACLLAGNAGFINGLGLSGALSLGAPKAVAAVTSAYTKAAVVLFEGGGGNLVTMLAILGTPLAYVLGSMLNGITNPDSQLIVERPHSSYTSGTSLHKTRRSTSTSSLPVLKSASLLVAAAIVASVGTLSYALPAQWISVWVIPYALSFAMGLQSSWTSMLVQANLLRTARFSGITSDIGTLLGKAIRGNTTNLWKVPIMIELLASFWAGGILGVGLVQRAGWSARTICYTTAFLYTTLYSLTSSLPRHVLHQYAHWKRRRSLLHVVRQHYHSLVPSQPTTPPAGFGTSVTP